MEELRIAKLELEKRYASATEQGISYLDFLRRLASYMEILRKNSALSSLVSSLKEHMYHVEILDIQKSKDDPIHRRLSHMRKQFIEEENDPLHRLYLLQSLEEVYDDFTQLGDSKDEEEFFKKEVRVQRDTKDGDDGIIETLSGNHMLVMARFDYVKKITPFHEWLLSEIDSVLAKGLLPQYLGYDAEKGILYVEGTPIQVSTRKQFTNAHYLLEYLFANDPFSKHFYDDMETDEVLGKSPRVYYGACEDIQSKVAKATGITDFLDFSSGKNMYVRVNRRYSSP